MQQRSLEPAEIARLGQERYERELRPKVEARHRGEYLVLDVETGAYEIDPDHLEASDRAAARRAGAPLFALCIGYPALGRIGSTERGSG